MAPTQPCEEDNTAAVASKAAAVVAAAALQRREVATVRATDLLAASQAARDTFEAAMKEAKAATEDNDTPRAASAATGCCKGERGSARG